VETGSAGMVLLGTELNGGAFLGTAGTVMQCTAQTGFARRGRLCPALPGKVLPGSERICSAGEARRGFAE
jgi:hypothetical protein